MDPEANIAEQRALVVRILAGQGSEPHYDLIAIKQDAERLAELVMALDEWRNKGGFDPYQRRWEGYPTPEQALAVGRMMAGRDTHRVELWRLPFDLPTGYVLVNLDGGQAQTGGFTAGVSETGEVSS